MLLYQDDARALRSIDSQLRLAASEAASASTDRTEKTRCRLDRLQDEAARACKKAEDEARSCSNFNRLFDEYEVGYLTSQLSVLLIIFLHLAQVIADTLVAWLSVSESELTAGGVPEPGQVSLLVGETEIHEPMAERANALFSEALNCLELEDEDDQRRIHAGMENRWVVKS